MVRISGATPGDERAIVLLCAELDEFYGQATAGTSEQRAAAVGAALFTDPPLARALLAWDGPGLAGLASYSFVWPADGLSAGLYLKELYVARAYRRAGTGKLLMGRPSRYCRRYWLLSRGVDDRHRQRRRAGLLRGAGCEVADNEGLLPDARNVRVRRFGRPVLARSGLSLPNTIDQSICWRVRTDLRGSERRGLRAA